MPEKDEQEKNFFTEISSRFYINGKCILQGTDRISSDSPRLMKRKEKVHMKTNEAAIDSFWSDERIADYEAAMEKVIEEAHKIDQEYYTKTKNHLIRFVEKRCKTVESIAQKLERKKKSTDKGLEEVIHDLAGVRIICFDTEQIDLIAKRMSEAKQFQVLKVKDYVRNPKQNGYQSYHMILEVDGKKVELQIRTILMDAWSSLDSILVYKKADPISDQMRTDIRKYAKWSRKMDKMVTNMMKQKTGDTNCKK